MLAVAKLGAIVMPTTGALGPADLADRIDRGGVGFVIANSADTPKFDDVAGEDVRIAVGDPADGGRHSPRRTTWRARARFARAPTSPIRC